MSSANSLTQVENAENARGEACWAPGAGKTLSEVKNMVMVHFDQPCSTSSPKPICTL